MRLAETESTSRYRVKDHEITGSKVCGFPVVPYLHGQPQQQSVTHSHLTSLGWSFSSQKLGPLTHWVTGRDWLVGEISWQSEVKIYRNDLCSSKHSLNCQFQLKLSLCRVNCSWERVWVPWLGMYVIFSPIFLGTTQFLTDLRIADLHIYISVSVCSMSKMMKNLKVTPSQNSTFGT